MKYSIDLSSEVALTLLPRSREEEIMQNLYTLIQTTVAEVPCYRNFGISRSYLHMPMHLAKTYLINSATDAIRNFFPELKMTGCTFTVDPDKPDKISFKIEVTDRE